jgi:hypothetical protein
MIKVQRILFRDGGQSLGPYNLALGQNGTPSSLCATQAQHQIRPCPALPCSTRQVLPSPLCSPIRRLQFHRWHTAWPPQHQVQAEMHKTTCSLSQNVGFHVQPNCSKQSRFTIPRLFTLLTDHYRPSNTVTVSA